MSYDIPSYTQTPNLFFDEHLPDMGMAETKIVLAVIRQTFGWHREKQRLTNAELAELTGLSKRSVINGVEEAIQRGVIAREKRHGSYQYWLVVEPGKGGEVNSPGEDGGGEVSSPNGEAGSQEGVKQVHPPSLYKGNKGKQSDSKESVSSSADASDATPSGDGEVGSVGEAEEAVTPTVDGESEDGGEERPPEERVEYEWTYKFSLAAMKHFRDHDLLAPVTEKKIEREGAEEVAVEWADTFRLMHEQDGYSPEEIASTMRWLFEGGNFWIRKSAIRSVPPLRSKTRSGDQYKFDSMYESARQDHEQESEADLYQQIYEGWE